MRHALLVVLLVVLVAATAAAVDVVLRNGTVIQATSYKISGGYLLVVLPNGRQVAYGSADVDLDALRAQEAAAKAAGEKPQPERQRDSMSAALATAGTGSGRLISDSDVEHVAPSGPASVEQKPTGPPPGYQEGGQVGMQSVKLVPVEPGVWDVQGEVVNRTSQTVSDIRVQIELFTDIDGVLGSAELGVVPSLEANGKASFTHRFQIAADKSPRIRGKVFWMQREASAPPPGGGGGARASATPRPTPIS